MNRAISEDSLAGYLELLERDRTVRTALMMAPRLRALGSATEGHGGQELRIALLGSGTLDQLGDCLTVEGYRRGWRPNVYLAGFEQFAQEMLEPGSGLYRFEPQVLALALHPRQLFPVLYEYPFDLSVTQRGDAIAAGVEALRGLVSAFRRETGAIVLLHNMVEPQHPALGILDWRDPLGQRAIFAEINSRLARLARDEFADVFIVDANAVQARCGTSRATDTRMWLAARLPWSEAMLAELSAEYMRYLNAAFGRARKCLVLDLDGTLWGGVVGEDGVDGLKLGTDPPGNAFVEFQRELLKLWKRGVLLTICSKNDPQLVQAAFRHPGMVLRESQFSAQRINWKPKPANLREIAVELNIGLDSLVFLDDSPVERAAVRAELPEVLCPDLPADPAYFRQTLLGLGAFDVLAVTEEDLLRNESYAREKTRKEFEAERRDGSLEDYLLQLETRAEITTAAVGALPRLAQLTQKTNQFNLTTRRYTAGEIQALGEQGAIVLGMRVSDRFGDSGVVGLAIAVPRSPTTWELDVLLLSCRVIGRGVESALLARVADEVRARGGTRLLGWFVPTERNSPARDCYERHGFRLETAKPDGSVLWGLDLVENGVSSPPWIEMLGAEMVAL